MSIDKRNCRQEEKEIEKKREREAKGNEWTEAEGRRMRKRK